MDLSVDQHRDSGIEVIGLRGRLVTETADLFSTRVDTALPQSQHVFVDMTHTSFLDHDGSSALLRAEHLARQQHSWFRVAGVHAVAQEVFTTFNGWARLGGNSTLEAEIERATARKAAEASFDWGRTR